MVTANKVTPRTRNRKPYYAPSENGAVCPHVNKDIDDKVIATPDENYEYVVKPRRATCKGNFTACSYNLGEKLPTGETICQRYEYFYEQEDQPVDTHDCILKVRGTSLEWARR